MQYTIRLNQKDGAEKSKWKKFFKFFGGLLIVLVFTVLAFGFGAYFASNNVQKIEKIRAAADIRLGNVIGLKSDIPKNEQISNDVNFKMFWELWGMLKKEYVGKDEITDKKLFYGAMRGMVNSLEDPYTVFMDPKMSEDFSNDLNGTFQGIGAEIGLRNEIITIIAPLDDTPADRAGILAGDQVLAINGTSTIGMTIDMAVKNIRGQKDTEVKLTIMRKGFDQTKDYTIKRDVIRVKSVKTEMRKDNIFVIKITNFNSDTESLFNEAAKQVIKDKPIGIILDLRNDPGGYLDTAISVASNWVSDGIIVSEQSSDGKKIDFRSKGRAFLKDFKTVVLVNGGSASASEIVSGALKDHNKAQLVGEKTFGKGSVQTVENLPDGSTVKITIAKWLTPSGKNIDKEGIEPDFKVELTKENFEKDQDPQMDKAVEIILEK